MKNKALKCRSVEALKRWKRALEEAQEIVARYRAEAPEGFDPQNLTATVTPSTTWQEGDQVSAAKLNLTAAPTIAFGGSVVNTDLAPGAASADKATPGAWFYASSVSSAATAPTVTKYAMIWGTNTAPTSLVDGLEISFKADAANGGAVSLDVGTGGEKVLKKHKGEDLDVGDIRANQVVTCRYGQAAGQWQMVSELGNRPVEYLTAAGTDAYTITPSPAYTALTQLVGRRFAIKFTNANTGAATINVNGLGALAIKKAKDQALFLGDIKSGQIIEGIFDDASPQVFQLQGQLGGASANAAISSLSNKLVIQNNSSNRIDFSADEIVLRNASTGLFLTVGNAISPVSITIDPTVPGANGLDTGSPQAGFWYYVYCISDGTNVRGLLSLSATTPTPVLGYVYKALIGACYINSTGPVVFKRTQQKGNLVAIATKAVIAGTDTVATNGAMENLAAAQATALQTAVPPIAKAIVGYVAAQTVNFSCVMAICSDMDNILTFAGINIQVFEVGNTGLSGSFFGFAGASFILPVTQAGPTFMWTIPDKTVLNRHSLFVTGYLL